MTVYKSPFLLDETIMKLKQVINEKELSYIQTINYQERAALDSIYFPPTRVILFEDRGLTFKSIACRQSIALDLPLKLLVWEENEDIYIGYFDPTVMKKRFMLQNCDEIIEDMSKLMVRIVNEVLRSE